MMIKRPENTNKEVIRTNVKKTPGIKMMISLIDREFDTEGDTPNQITVLGNPSDIYRVTVNAARQAEQRTGEKIRWTIVRFDKVKGGGVEGAVVRWHNV